MMNDGMVFEPLPMNNTIPKGNMTTHEWIMKLRSEMGMPLEEDTEEELQQQYRENEARAKRMELAGTAENYRKMFNRDPWTDEWLGPGPEEPMPFLDESKKDMKRRIEREQEEWKEKYIKENRPQIKMKTEKESKKVKKLREERKNKETREQRQEKYDVVYWYLEKFLTPKQADEIYYSKFREDQFEEMVDQVYEVASSYIAYVTRPNKKEYTVKEYIKRLKKGKTLLQQKQAEEEGTVESLRDTGMNFKYVEDMERHRKYIELDPTLNPDPEIPEEYEKEFKKWCKSKKKHGIKHFKKLKKKLYPFCTPKKGISAEAMQKRKFLEKINKRNAKFRKGMMERDYILGLQFASEEELRKFQKKQVKRYERTNREFVKHLETLHAKGYIDDNAFMEWADRSKKARKLVDKYHKNMREAYEAHKKENEERERHEKEYQKARAAWFKKFGGDIKDTEYLIVDGEKVKIEKMKTNLGDRYRVTRAHSMRYGPTLDECLR